MEDVDEKSSKVAIDINQIAKAISALYKYVRKVETKDLTSMLQAQKINLQFSYKKIPPTSNLKIKIPLPAAPVHESPEVCLFVKDIDKKNRDHEPTLHHYEDSFRSKNITSIAEIIPLKKLRNEYKPFEAKRSLSNQFDIFLCDSRIMHLIPSYLGKNFYGRQRIPLQVNMQAKDLKSELYRAICLTQCNIKNRGSSSMVSVGHTNMTEEQAIQNVQAAVLKIAENIPGGPTNIKNMYLKTVHSPSLPIYFSSGGSEDVALPKHPAKAPLDEPEEISTVEGAKLRVTPLGAIHIFPDGVDITKQKKKLQQDKKSKKEMAKKMKTEEHAEVKEELSDENTQTVKNVSRATKLRKVKMQNDKSEMKKPKAKKIKLECDLDINTKGEIEEEYDSSDDDIPAVKKVKVVTKGKGMKKPKVVQVEKMGNTPRNNKKRKVARS